MHAQACGHIQNQGMGAYTSIPQSPRPCSGRMYWDDVVVVVFVVVRPDCWPLLKPVRLCKNVGVLVHIDYNKYSSAHYNHPP